MKKLKKSSIKAQRFMRKYTIKKRLFQDRIITILSVIFSLFGLMFLFWILLTIFFKGANGFSLALFTESSAFGGLGNAILGQIEIVFFASLLGIPLGLMAGTFISEYSTNKKLIQSVKSVNDILASTPSIVIGAFIYAMLVVPFGGYSGIAGSFALCIMMIPIILQTTTDMLNLVPQSLREASFALGASKFQCIIGVVYRAAKQGLNTGIILAIARISGETAPLLFTNANNDFYSFDVTNALPSLSVSIYDFTQLPDEQLNQVAWAGALILATFVLGVNILGRVLIRKS